MNNVSFSPTRTYIAICSRQNKDENKEFFCKKFVLPEEIEWLGSVEKYSTNIVEAAQDFFIHRINAKVTIELVLPLEDFLNVTEANYIFKTVSQINRDRKLATEQ